MSKRTARDDRRDDDVYTEHSHNGEPCANPEFCDTMEGFCREMTTLMVECKRKYRETGEKSLAQDNPEIREFLQRISEGVMALCVKHGPRLQGDKPLSLSLAGALATHMVDRMMSQASMRADLILSGVDIDALDPPRPLNGSMPVIRMSL